MNYVYEIKNENLETIYIGRTNDLDRREKEHNRNCFNKKVIKKELYKYIRNETNIKFIKLYPVGIFKTKIEAKRFEMLLILQDFFGNKKLKQKVPSISDR